MQAIILQVSITDFCVGRLEYFLAGCFINALLACNSAFFAGLFFLLLTIALFSALLFYILESTYSFIFQAQGFFNKPAPLLLQFSPFPFVLLLQYITQKFKNL
jgi:hypothetical protein